MKALNPDEMKFWRGYLNSLPAALRPHNPCVEASIPGNLKCADKLISLYLSGKKTAASSLVKDFEAAGDPLPAPGYYWILLNSRNAPACIVKTVRISVHLFKDITEEIAKAEGEGDCSLAYWKNVHATFFAPCLERLRITDLQNAGIVTEFFELVYRPDNTSL